MPFRIGDDIQFGAHFIATKQGSTGLTVTVDVWRDGTEVVTGGSATERGDGLYAYTLAGASVTAAGLYVAVLKTTDSDVDQQHIAHAVHVTPAADAWDTILQALPSAAAIATAVWAAATRTLTSLAGQVAAIADAVWDEALSGHAVSGSTGEALSAAGGASDPLLNAVPGSYADGTAGAAIGRIGTAAITVTSPVDTLGNLTINQGADVVADFDNTAGTWDDLTGATVTIHARGAKTDRTDFSKALSVVTPTGSQKVRLTLADTETDLLQPGRWAHQVWAVLSGGGEKLLASGTLTVRKDLRT